MTFTSFDFFVFLALFLAIYYWIPQVFRIHILVMASMLFCYYAGGRGMLFSLAVSTVSTWYGAIQMEEAQSEHKKKQWFYGVLLLNVGILIVFKYLNFFVYTGRVAGKLFHREFPFQEILIAAPLGLSFYTLQMIGYFIDVSRGICQAQRSLLKYGAFSCYFPQLVTGPINRYNEMEKSLYQDREFDYKRFTFGLQRMVWGLFKKLVIAERMAVIVNTVYGDSSAYSGCYILFATFCFACQLYTDFSGAMDIAAGISEAIGIQIAENFDNPFVSRSLSEFWRRWHITLGSFMRDYIFYPVLKSELFSRIGDGAKEILGKKAGKKIPVYMGMVILWFTVGLWHGGAWKYIVGSGLLHCFFIISGQLLESWFKRFLSWCFIHTDCFSYHLFQRVRTSVLVCTGFVFFRSRSFRDGLYILKKSLYPNIWIFTDGSLLKLGLDVPDFIAGGVALGILWFVSIQHEKLVKEGSGVREKLAEQNLIFRWSVYYALIFSVVILGFYGPGYDASGFIYQNF